MMTPGRVPCGDSLMECAGDDRAVGADVVLAASGKVGTVSPHVLAPPERIDTLVTDRAAEPFMAPGVPVAGP
jgi:hypothetical protein